MFISEIFHSIQGEGSLVGMPSTFVRTSGCNLRCTWCDTPYTSWTPEGRDMPVARIMETVAGFDTPHVVVTGGEPMIAPDIADLCHALSDNRHHVTIETAGTVWSDLPCDLASISPKLANSTPHDHAEWGPRHEQRRINIPVLRRIMNTAPYQFKFVIDREQDVDEVDDLIRDIGHVDPTRVYLMPQGVTEQDLRERAAWLAPLCMQRGYALGQRLHIMLFGNRKGT